MAKKNPETTMYVVGGLAVLTAIGLAWHFGSKSGAAAAQPGQLPNGGGGGHGPPGPPPPIHIQQWVILNQPWVFKTGSLYRVSLPSAFSSSTFLASLQVAGLKLYNPGDQLPADWPTALDPAQDHVRAEFTAGTSLTMPVQVPGGVALTFQV